MLGRGQNVMGLYKCREAKTSSPLIKVCGASFSWKKLEELPKETHFTEVKKEECYQGWDVSRPDSSKPRHEGLSVVFHTCNPSVAGL